VLTSASRVTAAPPAAAPRADILKLDANGSTIPRSPRVEERLSAFIAQGGLSSYPDREATALRQRLAEYTSRADSEVLVCNGCDAAIDCAVRTFTAAGDPG
jgi:histidinol-phosphate/aromatic aminotransferase/cobyric acid decarboxylase-like protein